MAEPFAPKTTDGRNPEDGVPQPIYDRIAALEKDLAFHLERQAIKNQQIIDLVAAQRVRTKKIAALKAELTGLQYAAAVVAMMPVYGIKSIVTPEVVEVVGLNDDDFTLTETPMPTGDDTEDVRQAPLSQPSEDWGSSSADGTNRDPLRFFPTLQDRKEALRRAMEKWDRSSPFTSARIAGDTGLGSALETALAEGVSNSWLSKEGDTYRWIDRPSPPPLTDEQRAELQSPLPLRSPIEPAPATEVPTAENPPAAPAAGATHAAAAVAPTSATPASSEAPPASPMEILYQAIVRHSGQTAKIIKERAGLPDNYNTLFGTLSRNGRVRRDDAGNWYPASR